MKYYNLEKFLKNIVVFSNNDLKLLDDKYNSAKVNSWLDSWYIKKIRNWFYVLSNANFSEDLYFDNFWLNEEDFEKLTSEIKKELELLWFEVEIKNVYKWAWHCNIRFPGILFDSWLSKFQEEKILIQIDSVSQDYIYPSIKKMINKCDVIQYINTCPTSILLSKKIHALLARKRLKWRDFYDISFLYSLTKPDFDYLNTKIWIKNELELKEKLIEFCKDLDLEKIALDVEPFLIDSWDKFRISYFKEFLETL